MKIVGITTVLAIQFICTGKCETGLTKNHSQQRDFKFSECYSIVSGLL